ncbi:MAG: acyl-CoA thioesterase [Ilumatobacter sp.]|uniref:acyl-CoA thioesterase n=1 Tax=Ilumatobacter sp. TaxID=1967498 RepID=UPI00391D26B9
MFELSAHGHDVHVGSGPQYPWGGLYGGQIVAQALRAATMSVEPGLEPHSIRAYFIRRGDASEPIRYEVDRIRNGRSFATRRVVARQAIGAILNAESSFQRPEDAADVQTLTMPTVPGPDELVSETWTPAFERADVPLTAVTGTQRDGGGRTVTWMKVADPIGDPSSLDGQLLHRCWMTYLSDDLPTETVFNVHPMSAEPDSDQFRFAASLDHTVWFHRPVIADEWHLYDFACAHLVNGRGLAVGHVYAPDGVHVATIAQEVLVRDTRRR